MGREGGEGGKGKGVKVGREREGEWEGRKGEGRKGEEKERTSPLQILDPPLKRATLNSMFALQL